MLFHTTGLVLKITRFKENSAIVNVYTKDFGLKSYIINGLYSTKSKNKIAYYQPLNLLDMVVYNKNSTAINRVKEQKYNHMYLDIPFNFGKKTIIQVVNEILIHCIKEEEPNEQLFDFLSQSLKALDAQQKVSYFLLEFLVKLSRYLGFTPHNNFSTVYCIFDYKQGHFIEKIHQTVETMDMQCSKNFALLLQSVASNEAINSFSKEEKKEVLNALINYFQYQVENFKPLKSLKVLENMFSS